MILDHIRTRFLGGDLHARATYTRVYTVCAIACKKLIKEKTCTRFWPTHVQVSCTRRLAQVSGLSEVSCAIIKRVFVWAMRCDGCIVYFVMMLQISANLTDWGFLYIDLALLTPLSITCELIVSWLSITTACGLLSMSPDTSQKHILTEKEC